MQLVKQLVSHFSGFTNIFKRISKEDRLRICRVNYEETIETLRRIERGIINQELTQVYVPYDIPLSETSPFWWLLRNAANWETSLMPEASYGQGDAHMLLFAPLRRLSIADYTFLIEKLLAVEPCERIPEYRALLSSNKEERCVVVTFTPSVAYNYLREE